MKRVLVFCFLILVSAHLSNAQTLGAGDIAIIGANAVNPDEFAFVALVDIPQGTVIGFVDHGWLASGAFRTNEDEFFYTATGTVTKGTVIIIDTVGGHVKAMYDYTCQWCGVRSETPAGFGRSKL